ncbi:MAG TPA: carboxypeptidase-like regulatory domain-containing protein, partial [Terriglobales bacterium]|nr:carboxypeptidase-like regulatory domain-containing protein [Terriglobales bacterium]
FIARLGRYTIDVVKPGYIFPTQYLKDRGEDVDFMDLYHGLSLEIGKEGLITPNIPIDPVEPVESPRQVIFKKVLRHLQLDVGFVSVIVSMGALLVMPSFQIALFLLAQVGMFLLFRKISVSTHAKKWGIVFDQATRKPLDRVIVRIFDKKFNKLLETQATDPNGKYGFFVRRSIYYVTAERDGYALYTSPDIDLTTKNETLIDQNISLSKKVN